MVRLFVGILLTLVLTHLGGEGVAQVKSSDSLMVVPPTVMLPNRALELDSIPIVTLKRPSNLKTLFEYDPKSNLYLLTTYLGEERLGTPIPYTADEYWRYVQRRQMEHHFSVLERSSYRGGRVISIPSLYHQPSSSSLSTTEQLFGTGGFKFKLNGTIELTPGIHTTRIDNPSLAERARQSTIFTFDQNIQAGAELSLGTKLKLAFNYNTQSTLSSDARKIRLSYEGEEDEIIKLIEVGNVSMKPRNSLINGGSALFGMHTQMQFGRLTLDMLVSHQKSKRRIITSRGTGSITQVELSASSYDENRHFFLSDYFRSLYDQALATLPYVRSSVKVNKIEVWIVNRHSSHDAVRSVLAFADLGEANNIHSPNISLTNGGKSHAHNEANSLYSWMTGLPALRQNNQVTTTIGTSFRSGLDYERIEHARLLKPNEYELNDILGYITLNTRLKADEVLAVAYEYTYQGQIYKVGELSSDRPNAHEENLYVKLLKGSNLSPQSPYWHYMMRNAYSLGHGEIDEHSFELDILYRNDAIGSYTPYLPEESHVDKRLLTLLGLDQMTRQKTSGSDGRFDYLKGATINPRYGVIYLPSIEPFGRHLRKLGVKDSFVYEELYSQMPITAQQVAEKNKYILRGSYRSGSTNEIQLGTLGIAKGSVRISSKENNLIEGTDYIVDYQAGTVNIINEQLLQSGASIEVSLDDDTAIGMQRKTLLGLDANYQLSKDLQLGLTAMYLSEMPLTTRPTIGNESMRNFLWGANLSWRHESPRLTDWLNRLPMLRLTAPSRISLDADVAHLIPGHYEDDRTSGKSYLDDFESSRSEIDLINPYAWQLASVPADRLPSLNAPSIETGFGRAHLSWFSIDPIFTRSYGSLTPAYIRNNPDLISDHFVREVEMRELFPYRSYTMGVENYLPTLNLRYYPRERGQYNLSSARIGTDGYITDPTNSWAGIMRRIDQSDFESSNVEYLEFWLMDPFHANPTAHGGDLYFNLGDISEDILRDGRKMYENGLPTPSNISPIVETPWGKIPAQASLGYSFANEAGTRRIQDVGLDGLSDTDEYQFAPHARYLKDLRSRIDGTTLEIWNRSKHSPLNDPSGDNFRHYREAIYDNQKSPILERYKYFNGTDGNSPEVSSSTARSTVGRIAPDVEDINQDGMMNELDRYYEYRISLRPSDLRVGSGYIISRREAEIRLANGQISPITWYHFRIPLSSYTQAIGGINDLRAVRFMRMYLSGFDEVTNLRFGTLRLARGDWRVYTHPLNEPGSMPIPSTKLTTSSVNIEEHGDRQPIPYVLPPGITRSIDGQTAQGTLLNEQALSLKVQDLAPGDARAVYRNVNYDLRRYRKLQLFTHAESLAESHGTLDHGDLSVFIRFGSDYQTNYYEYSTPLEITPKGLYNDSNDADRRRVWPDANYLDVDLEYLTVLKRERNGLLASGGASLAIPYIKSDPSRGTSKVTILGNPSLSNIRTIMIGVRNTSGSVRSAEVWINELRTGDYNEEGGWAASTRLGLKLSDLADLTARGHRSTAGFGALDHALLERQTDDRRGLSLSGNIQLGKFFPESTSVSVPVYYSYSDECSTPLYSPRDEDVKLEDALASASAKERTHLFEHALTRRTSSTLSIANATANIRSKRPMPYDPANITINYTQTKSNQQSPDTEYHRQIHWQAGITYDYSPSFTSIKPFKRIKGDGSFARYLRSYELQLWPSRLNLSTTLMRQYEEELLRTPMDLTTSSRQSPIYAEQFMWYRKLSLDWKPIPDLFLSINTGTDARIEAPNVQVNRELNPDDYIRWRDAVDRSIATLGTPQHYAQEVRATLSLPTQSIRALSWLSASANYTSHYSWDLGATLPNKGLRLANTIANDMQLELSSQLRLNQLYMRSKYLASLEKRFGSPTASTDSRQPTRRTERTTSITTLWEDIIDRTIYTLMMVRDISLSWRRTTSTHLPGYLPSIGKAFGQGDQSGILAPGIGFSLGLTGNEFIERSRDLGWLSDDQSQTMPAMYSAGTILDLKAVLRPLRDLTIHLNANYTHTDRTEHQFMHVGNPRILSGDLLMTTVGLRGFFSGGDPTDGYKSASFDLMRSARSAIAQRLASSIADEHYPSSGWLQGTPYAGTPIGSTIQTDLNTPAVLIPAFRRAYLGSSYETGFLPRISALLPNWSITYTGLGKLQGLRDLFRSITLKHTYRGIYRMDGYTSLAQWVPLEGHLGLGIAPPYIGSASTPRLSLGYDIATISLQENFFPLIGIDLSLKNGLTFTGQWRRSRALTLGLTAYRLIETSSNDINLAISYRISDIRALFQPINRHRKSTNPKADNTRGLSLKADFSAGRSLSLIRQINEGLTQASTGVSNRRMALSMEYDLSRLISLKAYYELMDNRPLVSTTAFPILTHTYGLTLRLNLNQGR